MTEELRTSIRSPGTSEGAAGTREASALEACPLSPVTPTAGPVRPSDLCLAHSIGPYSAQALGQVLYVGRQENKLPTVPVVFHICPII